MKTAAADVASGKFLSEAAKQHDVSWIILSRRIVIKKTACNGKSDNHTSLYVCKNIFEAKRIFTKKKKKSRDGHLCKVACQSISWST